jgi:hypothetical protein
MVVNFTTTAMNRPDIVNATYASFYKNLKGIDWKKSTLLINIDPLPEGDREAVVRVGQQYFGHVRARLPKTPNYTAAYNWLWSNADSPIIFNLEDDWELTREVDANMLASFFDREDTLYAVALRAYPHTYISVPTSPAFLHERYYKAIGGNLDPTINPEIQLRGSKWGIDMPTKRPEYGPHISTKGKLHMWPEGKGNQHIVVKDIGREWMLQSKFRRPEGKSNFTTWVPNEEN